MGASKCPTRLLACRNAASSDDAFDDLEDQTVSVTNLDDELAPPRPSGAPAPEPQASTQVVPLTEDVPPEDGVVMIEYPRPGLLAVGFLTGFTTVSPDRTLAIVYLPTAPLPNSGWIAYVPVQDVYDTNLSVAQTMQTVFSSGLEYPDSIDIRRLPEPHGRGCPACSITS